MAYLRVGLLALFTLASGACMRGDDEFVVPLGHPADAGARPGAILAGSGALEPELQTVKPQVGGSPAPAQPAPASGGHRHHQH